MDRWLPAAVLLLLVVLQTAAQFAFWRAYQRRYPDRLTGSAYLSAWDGTVPDERRGLWYRINLLFAPVDDRRVDGLRRRALFASAATLSGGLVLVAWSVLV